MVRPHSQNRRRCDRRLGPPRISPEGKQVVAGKRGEKSRAAALWVLNAIVGSAFLWTHTARGSQSQPELLYRDASRKVFGDWSSDGDAPLRRNRSGNGQRALEDAESF
jgi:hypothetical protein